MKVIFLFSENKWKISPLRLEAKESTSLKTVAANNVSDCRKTICRGVKKKNHSENIDNVRNKKGRKGIKSTLLLAMSVKIWHKKTTEKID